MQALDDHYRRDRMLENQLLLVIGFQNERILIETLNTAREFHSAQKVNGYDALFFARIVQKAILYILRRFIHSARFCASPLTVAWLVVIALYQESVGAVFITRRVCGIDRLS